MITAALMFSLEKYNERENIKVEVTKEAMKAYK